MISPRFAFKKKRRLCWIWGFTPTTEVMTMGSKEQLDPPSNPTQTMFFPIDSMHMVYLPTWKLIKINHSCREIYRSSHVFFCVFGSTEPSLHWFQRHLSFQSQVVYERAAMIKGHRVLNKNHCRWMANGGTAEELWDAQPILWKEKNNNLDLHGFAYKWLEM